MRGVAAADGCAFVKVLPKKKAAWVLADGLFVELLT